MATRISTTRRVRQSILAAFALIAFSNPAGAQSPAPGGFLETTTSTETRARVTPALPARGPFTFPAPYHTLGVRITNASDCGGHDCVDYVGYSYWRNTNNHVGSNTMLIYVTLDRARGGAGPTLFSYDKTTDQITEVGPLFDAANPLSWATGEGWYWSPTQATKLYIADGAVLSRYDVFTKQREIVFDASTRFPGTVIWQTHTSNDDAVHSATLRDGTTSEVRGCVVYSEATGQFSLFAKTGDFDECQVDKSGQWLLIKEQVDGANGEDNVIVNLSTGQQTVFLDQLGAPGHSDNGFGYMVGEDNWYNLPGAARLWQFGQALPGVPPQGRLVYHTTDWSVDLGHLSHANARSGLPIDQQYACVSHASRLNLPRANEIVCFQLDGSLKVLVVAPVMTNLDAPGGGDDYSKLPKGNLDLTGQYFVWTSNVGGNRLDAFVVKVPSQLLVTQAGSGGGTPPTVSITAPNAGATLSGTVSLSASASSGTAGVQFKLNGANLGSALTAPPYALAWDTTTSADGAYTLTATAWDASGKAATSSGVAVTVSNGSSFWTDVVHAAATGNSLKKTAGCDGCPDAGAISLLRIRSGNAAFAFTASETTSLRYVGLSVRNAVTSPSQIRFAIALQPGGIAEIRENGTYRTDTPFAPGDVFKITVESRVVRYFKNGALIYQSTLRPTYPLLVSASLFSSNSTLSNVTLGKLP
ncbi:MAG: hypothetical protein C5B48_06140 [Candidatus Rokuibacteriota bacterium]|nr:MAG: hypothetical protein C5B48_06140 [Candidatus Rokubacteria bacterium]